MIKVAANNFPYGHDEPDPMAELQKWCNEQGARPGTRILSVQMQPVTDMSVTREHYPDTTDHSGFIAVVLTLEVSDN